MKEFVTADAHPDANTRGWRSRTVTKVLLFGGIAAGALYVLGDLVSGLVYNATRPYSFRDQWISELTALGSPVRPLMVTIITIYGLLLFAFAYGILRVAGERRSLRWTGLVLILAVVVTFPLHPFFPMSSRWLESGFNDTMHGIVTFAWIPIILASVALSAVAYRGWFRLYAIATVVAMTVFGIATGIAIQAIEQNDTPWAGVFERINAYALAAWLGVLAVTVIRRSFSGATPERRVTEVRTSAQTKEPSLVSA